MKLLYVVLYIVGVCFLLAGIMGHSAAWNDAVLCFCAATTLVVRQIRDKSKK